MARLPATVNVSPLSSKSDVLDPVDSFFTMCNFCSFIGMHLLFPHLLLVPHTSWYWSPLGWYWFPHVQIFVFIRVAFCCCTPMGFLLFLSLAGICSLVILQLVLARTRPPPVISFFFSSSHLLIENKEQ